MERPSVRLRTPGLIVLLLAILAAACAAPGTGVGSQSGAQQAGAPSSPTKRITAAVLADPPFVYARLNPPSTTGGTESMVHVGLTRFDRFGVRGPALAKEAPSVENGLWRVFPDGKMQLTWNLRPDAQWHDGTPFTSADVVFTANVVRDRDVPQLRDRRYDMIESVEAPDPHTVVVNWRQTYIEADALFTYDLGLPIAKHIVEGVYAENKAGLFEHAYWSTEFVGAGPYRLKEYVPSSHALLEANDRYVLGRPKVDVIEVKFIPESNTMIANLLSGTVDVGIGRNISLDQALQMRDNWRAGRMEIGYKSWHVIYPQLLNPTPAVVTDVQFRRALLQAIDREQMAETLIAGLSSVAHNYLNPQEPEHNEVMASVTQYAHDPRRSMQMIESLGYRLGADGGFRDADGQQLSVQLWANAQLDVPPKAALAIADYWQRAGVKTETSMMAPQMLADLERVTTFPSFTVSQNPDDKAYLQNFHSSNLPLPSNNFTGQNKPRYSNAEFDRLLDRFYVTISRGERTEVLRQIVAHISDQLPLMGLFYNVEPTMVNNRVLNVYARTQETDQGRNVHEWDVTR